MGLTGSWQGGGLNAVMGGGGLSFINPERGGDGAADYPIYLQPVRGNWRGGQRVLLRRLGCYGTQGTPLQRYICTYSGGMDGSLPAFSCKWIQCC